MSSIETLPYLLKTLRLPAIAQYWQERAILAKKVHSSYGVYLADVLELEANLREQNRLKKAYRHSKLPTGKTLASFCFSQVPSLNPAQIQGFSEDASWVNEAQNLVLLGPSGTGKTHVAAAIGYGLIERGVKVFFAPTTLLVQTLQKAKTEYALKQALERLSKFQLLILDDIAYVKKTEQETSVLFELIAYRYETGSLLITANQAFSNWGEIFPDKVMAVAAIDRIVHHSTIIKVDGESYRAAYAKKKKFGFK
jgi:DNA replication protein DnaC